MRRIITILLVVLLLFSNSVFAAHTSFDTLSALKALPDEFGSTKADKAATREELAYIVAKIFSNEEKPATDTRFTDVTLANKYSGYIEFLAQSGIISGVNGSEFNPTDSVNIHMACKMLVCVLGMGEYAERAGGYPYGYYEIANQLGILKGIQSSADGILSQNTTVQMIENALFADVGEMILELKDGSFVELENDMLLYRTFGVEIYNGTITDVFQDTCSAMFTATSKKNKNSTGSLNVGVKTYVDADSSVDLNKWENVPITVWINSDNKIIYAYPQNGVEVRYEYIDSVNGDTEDGALYSINEISRLTMRYDEEEYDVSAGTQLKYNNKMTDTAVPLVGSYAKVVLKNDEVFYVESWEMTEGGIITSASAYEIVYTKGRTQNYKLEELDKFKNKKIFIGGRSADINELRVDSVFFYNISGDSITIIATEKAIVDVFSSYTSNQLKIGDALYKYRNIYYSEDGVNYKEDENFNTLLGKNVKAYLAPDGYVLYLQVEKATETKTNKFYGIVTGVEKDNLDDKTAQIKMYRVDSGSPEEVIYEIDKNTVYYDGINLQLLKDTAKDYRGKCVYYFELSSKGKVKSIKKPHDFKGFEGESAIAAFSSEARIAAGNGKVVYCDNVKMVAIYQKNGEFTVGCYSWADFVMQDPAGTMYVHFLGDGEYSSLPTMALVTGDFTRVGNRYVYHGIITDITDGINADGELCKNVTILDRSLKTYQLPPEEVRDLKLYDMLSYSDGQKFSDVEIYRRGTHIHLPDVINSWQNAAPLKVGYVEYIDDKIIYLENGDAYYFNITTNFFAEMEERSNGQYKVSSISYADIKPGDRVICVAADDGVRGVIKITD